MTILLINRIKDKRMSKKIKLILYIGYAFQFVFFIFYRMELFSLGREVYYSDAEVYWLDTLTYLEGNRNYVFNASYIWTCVLLQKTSPFIWVGWNNIYNILIMDLSIVICSLFILENYKHNNREIDDKFRNKIYIYYFLNLYNPLVLFGYMRNLKDATFLFYVCITIYILYLINLKRSIYKDIFYCGFLAIMAVIAYGIRPWAFIISIFAVIFFVYENKKINKNRVITLLTLSLLLGVLFVPYIQTIYASTDIWVGKIGKESSSMGILSILKSIFTLVIGPGYLRSLYGSEYFMFSLVIGNIMCFLGSIMWWFQLPYMITMLKNPITKIKKSSGYIKYFILMTIAYIGIYSISYGGSTEIRMRSTLYILVSTIFFSVFDLNRLRNKINIFCLITFIVFILGTISSL